MGLTQAELEVNFAPHLRETALKFRLNEKELLERIQNYYGGFSFDGQTLVCNPFSIQRFFGDGEFKTYWPLSGFDAFIRKLYQYRKLKGIKFSGCRASSDFVYSPGEIWEPSSVGFLYQAGFLTLRKTKDDFYTLDYPNSEVRSALSALGPDIP
jgi:hypothetical protein